MKTDRPTPHHNPPVKKILEKNLKVEYSFIPGNEAELRTLCAYEMVFSEIEEMLEEEKGYEQQSTNN